MLRTVWPGGGASDFSVVEIACREESFCAGTTTTDRPQHHPIGGAPRTQIGVPGIELIAVHWSLWKSQVFKLSVFIFAQLSQGPARSGCVVYPLYALTAGRDCGRRQIGSFLRRATTRIFRQSFRAIQALFYESLSLSHSVRLSLLRPS